jgi:hypothetical protein
VSDIDDKAAPADFWAWTAASRSALSLGPLRALTQAAVLAAARETLRRSLKDHADAPSANAKTATMVSARRRLSRSRREARHNTQFSSRHTTRPWSLHRTSRAGTEELRVNIRQTVLDAVA